MYLDLDPTCWPEESNIIDHPVIRLLLAGLNSEDFEEESAGNFGFGVEYLIDEMEGIHNTYPLIDDADSSQHSALIDAVNGENLVIEGPPGTGKSQTITNLIAATMAQGKKVLFVAEKLAALEVVRSRLDAVGLGEFCLELHSHKSQKLKVLEEVNFRLKKHGHYRKPDDIDVEIARYEELKTQLKKHAERINSPWKNTGKSLHEIFTAATRYRKAVGINPEALHPKGYNGEMYNVETRLHNEDQVQAYTQVYQAVANQLGEDVGLENHPWYGVRNSSLQIFDLDRVIGPLSEWQSSLQKISSERENIGRALYSDSNKCPETLQGLKDYLTDLECLPVLKGDELLDRLQVLKGDVLVEAQHLYTIFDEIQSLYASLADKMGPEVLGDLSIVDQFVAGSEQLRQLIGDSVRLGELAGAINRLTAIQDQLEQLNPSLNGIQTALGEIGASHLSISKSGLAEYKTIIELVSDLAPSCWKLRDELFDNDELDDILPELQKDLKELHGLQTNLEFAYSLDNLPGKIELQQLESLLVTGGFFKWFKSSWREARKQVLSYAANPKVKFSTLLPLLYQLSDYFDKRQQFENNNRYIESLGSHLQGPQTDYAH